MVKNKLTAERARELLDYNAETGDLTWKISNGRRAVSGALAGHKNASGYLFVGLDGKVYMGHRLAWLIHTGAWPEHHIDHIDGTPSNNAIANLRDVSRTVNSQNQRRPSRNNTTGLLGVSREYSRFVARIMVNGKSQRFGVHDTPELAHAAYLTAKRIHHVGCTI